MRPEQPYREDAGFDSLVGLEVTSYSEEQVEGTVAVEKLEAQVALKRLREKFPTLFEAP